ncbi:MAG: PAS domain-containing protein, partial [Alphaproteobacteria bacterium]|nr:PAS domain-containing protein [Alphaproteobacteria bacterium]
MTLGGGDRNLADRPSPPARPEGARGWSFADTLDLVSECVAVFDAKDILSYCNQRYADLVAGPGAPLPIGASFQQLLRSTLADDFSGAELEMRLKARMSMWRASPNQTIDQERANGRWFRIRENSLPDGRVVLIISDISDLKSQELALRTGESRFRDFTMAASDWFWETDANLRLTFVAEGVLHSLGRPVSDVIGKSLAQFIREGIYAYENPNDAARLRAATQVREPYHGISLYYFWPDGTKRVVVLGGTPFFDGRGEFLGYRGASRDVTAVVESRREIERRRVLLDAILENLTQGITAVDRDLGVVAVNHRARELLEFPEEVMREGARFEDIIRYNALRGEYGPGDPEMQVSSRVELARKFQ